MSFFDFLDKLRNKPEPVKSTIAFWFAIGLTLLIAVFWASTLINDKNKTANKGPSPFEMISNAFKANNAQK